MKSLKKALVLRLAIIACLITFTTGKSLAQSMKDGMEAEELFKYQAAKSIYNKILAKEPANAAAYYHLGIIAYYNYQFDSAKYLFDKGASANANEPLIFIGYGLFSIKQKNKEQAKQNFEKAIAMSNNKDAYVMQQVTEAIWHERYVDMAEYAFETINKALALDKKSLRAMVSLGDAYRLKDDSNNGIKQYRTIADANPKYLLALLRVGECYAKVPNFEAAEEVFKKIISQDPNYPPVYADLGELYSSKKDLSAKAKESYSKFMSLAGSSPSVSLRYATFLYLISDFKSALDELNKILVSLPDNTSILRLKAYCEYETGDIQNGINTFQRLFIVAKENTIGKDFVYYGKLLIKNKQDSLGVANLNKAMVMDTAFNPDIYDLIIQSYDNLKKYKEAAALMEIKLQRSRGNIKPFDYFTLGRLYYLTDNYLKADTNYALVNKFFPTYVPGYLYRARSNAYMDTLKVKNYKAKPFYEKYLELAAADPAKYKNEIIEAQVWLAGYYYNQKDYVKSKEFALKVKELDPDNKLNNTILKAIADQKEPKKK